MEKIPDTRVNKHMFLDEKTTSKHMFAGIFSI